MGEAGFPENPHAGPEEISRAVETLRRGGLVAFPTETVYGLGADALDAAAVRRVFELKGRPSTNPLIVHVSGEAMARTLVSRWPEEASRLARAYWPGPLTMVLPRTPDVPDVVTGDGPTVAVRCPDHHVILALLEAFGRPLVGPSANPSGQVSPTTAQHVREAFPGADVYVLEGGPCRGGIESTVVSLVSTPPRILRPGLIGAEELSIVAGRPVSGARAGESAARGGAAKGGAGAAGAPRAPAVLFNSRDLGEVLAAAPRVVVLGPAGSVVPPPHALVPMPAGARGYAARLYAAMREADALNPDLIAIERPGGEGPIWQAVVDRVSRAAIPFRA